MSKVQEYLNKKKIATLGLPKMWTVKSTRLEVNKPEENQIIEIIPNVAFRGNLKLPIDRYKLENLIYVDILRGEISATIDGYGTGIGDLWSWTYFSSLNFNVCQEWYLKELERVKEKYDNRLQNYTIKQ